MKNSLDGFKDRFEQTGERIIKLKDRTVEMIQSEEQKGKKTKEKQIEPEGPMGHH